jgi:hypothetical protein
MNFSFDATAGASQSSTTRLVGNEIHTVKLESCEKVDFEGKKDPSKTFKVLKFKFSNEDGIFEHVEFEPTKENGDFERTTSPQGYPQASKAETAMLFFKHVIDGFNPAVAKQIDSKEKSLGAPSWDKLRDLMVEILKNSKNTENKIKLLKNNKGEAQFPGFYVGISKEGKSFIKNNFIGNKVAFTPYEIGRIKKESEAAPTNMQKQEDEFLKDPTPESDDSLDLNFDLA